MENDKLTSGALAQSAAPLTFGQRLVGLNFNPSNDDKVGKAKQLFAQIADLLKEEHTTRAASGGIEAAELNATLYTHAIGEILNAQMNVVKVLTLNY